MKTIVNKLRFALLLGFVAIGMTVLAQEIANIEKMSISTQMFLDELSGKYSFDRPQIPLKANDGSIVDPEIQIHERHIARPDTIDGKVYASAFIRVTREDDINILESLGVIIRSRFDKGRLVTSLIPVDKIQDVAAIEGVQNIEVAIIMETDNDNARQTTNAYDVLTYSNDAISAGLLHGYDGSGVVLGVIDTGIDFQHKAFQDKNGNTRIKGVYCYRGSNLIADWTGSGTLPTTDKTSGDHGSHTSSIAGGSNVIIDGTNVTVTDDPSQATYGGMAPGADLYLAGVSSLYSTRIVEAFQKMVNYADTQNKPLVVSNSYGSTSGPHDGGSYSGYSSAINELFGDAHPNRIAVFSTGNEAGDAYPSEGGGKHVYGNASSTNPLRTILRCHYYSNRDGGYYYSGDLASIWCRSTSVSSMVCRILVIDTHTGEVLKTVTTSPSSEGTEVSGLSDYYSGTLMVYLSRYSNKVNIFLTAETDMKSESYDTSNNNYSDYSLAIEVYPNSGSAIIDIWGQDYSFFTDFITTNGYNWTNGSDDMTTNDFANNPNIVSVGSYVSRERSSGNSLGDISKFSSYATPEANPLGKQLPWITAPGEVIISAYNHYNTSRGSSYIVSVNNSTYPYGQMSGTSMACPAAAGIVALWFQAAKEIGMDLTLSQVKDIMQQTAIRDYWVLSGPNSTHFGNGKIDALAGIQYILNNFHVDPITSGTVSPDALSFGNVAIGRDKSMTVNVTNTGNQPFTPVIDMSGLPSEFTVTGNSEVFQNGSITLTVTYTPTTEGQQSGSFTITIADQTHTITVTANGFIINSTLISNMVMAPVYHSDLQVGGTSCIFTEDDIILDTDMHLEYDGDDSDVQILVKSDEAITRYDLKNKDGEEGTWGLAGSVAHQGNSYVYGEKTMTFLDGATEMWFPMDDNTVKVEAVTYYVPVTVANGVISTGNTYGAPIVSKTNEDVNMTVIISGSKSDKRLGGHWTHLPDSVEYCVYTTIVDITCNDLDGVKLKPYMYRAWVVTTGDHPIYNFTRNDKNAIVGTNELEVPYLLGEIGIEDGDYGQHVVIGQEWDPTSGVVKMQNAFGAPCYGAQISVVVRAYYQPGSGSGQTKLRGNRNGDMYGFAQSGGDEQFDLPTGVMEFVVDKEIVSVIYVNPMGMVSQTPFDGMNIVVTRYSDGTTSTAKVMR